MTPVRSFLSAMFEGGGNIPLILPVIARLVARGNQVKVLAGPSIRRPNARSPSERFLKRITATGANVVVLPEPRVHPLASMTRHGLAFGWTPSRLFKANDLALTSRWSSTWADAVVDEVGRDNFDVLVADYFLLGALAAGEQLGLPTAALVHTATLNWPIDGLPAPGSGFGPARTRIGRVRDALWAAAYRRVATRDGLPSLNRARARLGLEAVRSIGEQFDATTRLLVLGSRTFDFPARRLPTNLRYVGTPFDEVTEAKWNSPWPPGDGRPLLLVSLSTLPQGQAPLMHRILTALSEMPVRALVTLGPSLDPAEFAAPPNVHLEVFIPHAAVLPHVAAVVTQCGFSTITKTLIKGVPLVCLPLLADQPDNAARVVALGAGVRLHPEATPAQIREAIAHVIGSPNFREAAQRVSLGMKSENGSESAAVELESLVASGSR